MMKQKHITAKFGLLALLGFLALALSGCISSASAHEIEQAASPGPTTTTTATRTQPAVETPVATSTSRSAPLPTRLAATPATATPQPIIQPSPTAIPLNPEAWKDWPELPVVSAELREIYRQGVAMGNNPHAFSVLGDCQSQPDVFMGVFDSDPQLVEQLPLNLRQTVRNFSGSFDRYSPAVKDGTTEGALLYALWNDNKENTCEYGETPLECELRVHNPSIVFIHVGTHWEARNRIYLNKIIDRILEHRAVPVLVTKADNLELDERINRTYAEVALERDLPLWNFFGSVQHLPNNGMKDEMYLSDEALIIHRNSALEALDAVWRAVK